MNPLIFLHAIAGLLGTIAFVWVLLELKKPAPENYAMAHTAAALGVMLLLFSWAMGGYHYVTVYGPQVKPLVKETLAWVHDIGTESKEHLFLFLPFLALADLALIDYAFRKKSLAALKIARTLAAAIVVLGLIITVEGFLITNTARAALEAQAP